MIFLKPEAKVTGNLNFNAKCKPESWYCHGTENKELCKMLAQAHGCVIFSCLPGWAGCHILAVSCGITFSRDKTK